MNRREFLVAAQTAATVPHALAQTTGTQAGAIPVSLWLDPIDEHRRPIQDLISGFVNKYGVPNFRPHCTLASGNIPNLGQALYDLFDKVDRFCAEQGRVSLSRNTRNPIDFRDKGPDAWSTFQYLALQSNRVAQDVFDRAERIFHPFTAKKDTNDDKSRLIHVSLSYAEVAVRGDIDRRNVDTSRLPEGLTFGSLKVVVPEGGWADIINPALPVKARRWNVVYSRLLLGGSFRKSRRRTRLRAVVSGGQEGGDQKALAAALKVPGLAVAGYCPKDRETRILGINPVPPEFPLEETPVRDSTNAIGAGAGAPGVVGGLQYVDRSQRTEWNCLEADGVLLVPASITSDLGTIWTVRFAKDFKKPICGVNPYLKGADKDKEINSIISWLDHYRIEVLNVAGPAHLDDSVAAGEFFRDLFVKATSES